jgi:hypothetical protein
MTAVGWHVTGLGSLTDIASLDYNHLDITSMTQIHPLDLLNLTGYEPGAHISRSRYLK